MLVAPDAAHQDGTYPRPQLVRDAWRSLDGAWDFARDPQGATAGPATGPGDVAFDRQIVVPFAPETEASGVHETGPCALLWYRRIVTVEDLTAAGHGTGRERVLLHFGAVDHHATVWFGGQRVGEHTGGYAPFTVDVSDVVAAGGAGPDGGWELVVRAQDDPRDPYTPRGKQDWHDATHAIWYERQTGIWQSVWMEAVPAVHVERLWLSPQVREACVDVEVQVGGVRGLSGAPVTLAVELSYEGRALGSVQVSGQGGTVRARVPVPQLENGQARDELTWSPERPRLVSAAVRLTVPDGADGGAGGAGNAASGDVVGSYTGLRDIRTESGQITLNAMPCFVRAVLEQGYWPTSGYTAPDLGALRTEVEAILRLGFNCARVHQKVEDPRFLYWADRLGLMVWAEIGNAYAFGTQAVQDMYAQWPDLVLRDRSHPSVIAWVPINESWGVQDVRVDPRQQAYARSLADVTRALDGTRPVLSNDGWEHTSSDLWTIHDYSDDIESLADKYGSRENLLAMLDHGPDGRPIRVGEGDVATSPASVTRDATPFLLTEFGGLRVADDSGAWGWSVVASAEVMAERLAATIDAVTTPALAGFCYTQLTDTLQEANGLLTVDRQPKLDWDVLRAAITGRR